MNFECLSRETLLVSELRSYPKKTYDLFSICDAYEPVEIESLSSTMLSLLYILFKYMTCGGWHDLYMLLTHSNLSETSESGAKYSEIT